MLMEEDAVHHFRWWRRSFYLEPFRVFIFSRLIHGIDWSGNDLAEVIAMIKWGFPPVLFAFVKFECRETIFFSSTREHRHIFRSFKANVSRSNDKKKCRQNCHRKRLSVRVGSSEGIQAKHNDSLSSPLICSHLLSYTHRTLCWTRLCSLYPIRTRFSFKCHSVYRVSITGSHAFLLPLIYKWVLTLRAGHLHVIITNYEKKQPPIRTADARVLLCWFSGILTSLSYEMPMCRTIFGHQQR